MTPGGEEADDGGPAKALSPASAVCLFSTVVRQFLCFLSSLTIIRRLIRANVGHVRLHLQEATRKCMPAQISEHRIPHTASLSRTRTTSVPVFLSMLGP
jgi:hypothetical protein